MADASVFRPSPNSMAVAFIDTNLHSKSPRTPIWQRGIMGDFRLPLKANCYEFTFYRRGSFPGMANSDGRQPQILCVSGTNLEGKYGENVEDVC